jgi:hypothetical protein
MQCTLGSHLPDAHANDSRYNGLFFSINQFPFNTGFFAANGYSRYSGTSMLLEFANGTTLNVPLVAGFTYDFTDVYDGPSFYQQFCNATAKAARANAPDGGGGGSSKAGLHDRLKRRVDETNQPDPNRLRYQYPTAVAISDDASLAGYFLDEYPHLAILSISEMSEKTPQSVQRTLMEFLDQCRSTGKVSPSWIRAVADFLFAQNQYHI